jgi:type I restriction enzyme, S subunit
MAFPKYESYKDSGVEWLGEIPIHWTVQRHLGLFNERKEINQPEMELLSVTIEQGVILQSEIFTKKDSSNEDKSKYKVVRKGDLAYNKMRMWQGAIGMSDYDGIVSPAYVILNTHNKEYSKYFHYLYRTEIFIREANRHSYGLCSDMNSLRYEDFKTIYSPIPPQDEVGRILAFLERTTAEIDEAIAKKQRLIKLLQEQKAILINQAVTKGLNPNVPMRDSGIEWIGEIPEHWEVKRLKYFSYVQSGITLGKTYTGHKLVSYPYLRVANVQYGYFNLNDVAELVLPPREAERYFVKSGDILVTEGGDIDKLGRGMFWEGQIDNCIHQNHIFAIRLNKNIASEYFVSLVMAADSGRKYFTTTAIKTTNLASTNKTKLGNFPILIPPIDEQLQLIEYSKSIDREYDNAISTVSNEVERLNELRHILISSAVTGKIKV